ncbi:MAG: hypothetical protein AAFV31_01350 [Pseudomonadota bacterium]
MLAAGCLDIRMAIDAGEASFPADNGGDVLFPDKIVQAPHAAIEQPNFVPEIFSSSHRSYGNGMSKFAAMRCVSLYKVNSTIWLSA